jgi:drug/metabolite transporter (DMT)-like permease
MGMLSGFFLALHFATWISSLNHTTIANSVVLVNTNPIWVGLFTPLITQERIGRIAVLSIIISVMGGVIIGAEDFRLRGDALLGDGLAVAGSICAAVYLLLGRTIRQEMTLLSYIFICYGAAAVFLWATVLGLDFQITGYSTRTVWAFWAMALVTQLIGHSSYNWALKWIKPHVIAVSLLGEPIGATILAYIIFHEPLSAAKVVGALFIFAAIYISAGNETPVFRKPNRME